MAPKQIKTGPQNARTVQNGSKTLKAFFASIFKTVVIDMVYFKIHLVSFTTINALVSQFRKQYFLMFFVGSSSSVNGTQTTLTPVVYLFVTIFFRTISHAIATF